MLWIGRFNTTHFNILKFNRRFRKVSIKITAGIFILNWQADSKIYVEMLSM